MFWKNASLSTMVTPYRYHGCITEAEIMQMSVYTDVSVCVYTVSYTHLDVYKRQEINKRTLVKLLKKNLCNKQQ